LYTIIAQVLNINKQIMILSNEQQHILDEVRGGDNVMVDAVAGTGKTTLILSIARELPDKRILQLTYNASLRKDVKDTIELFVKRLKC